MELQGKSALPDMIKQSFIVEMDPLIAPHEREPSGFGELHQNARNYLHGFTWHAGIYADYFGGGLKGKFGVFLFEIVPRKNRYKFLPNPEVDRFLWVLVGMDMPSVYLVVDHTPDWVNATEGYVQLMQDWIDAVRNGASLEGKYPVEIDVSQQNVDKLQKQIDFLQREVLEKHKDLLI